jgi:hypothetical protein
MANDYLSGSQFGQVAGTLLARRRRQDKDQAKRALFASALFETFGAFQRRQQTNLNEDLQNLQSEYSNIFKDYEAKYNNEAKNRERLREYNSARQNEFLEREAQERLAFNLTDKDKQALGIVSGSQLAQLDFSDVSVREQYNNLIARQKDFIRQEMDALKDNPFASSQSFSTLTEPVLKELQAKANQLKDDPARQGLFYAAIDRIFGDPDNINKGPFAKQQIELKNAVDNAVKVRQEQDTKYNNFVNQYKSIVPTNVENFSEEELLNFSDQRFKWNERTLEYQDKKQDELFKVFAPANYNAKNPLFNKKVDILGLNAEGKFEVSNNKKFHQVDDITVVTRQDVTGDLVKDFQPSNMSVKAAFANDVSEIMTVMKEFNVMANKNNPDIDLKDDIELQAEAIDYITRTRFINNGSEDVYLTFQKREFDSPAIRNEIDALVNNQPTGYITSLKNERSKANAKPIEKVLLNAYDSDLIPKDDLVDYDAVKGDLEDIVGGRGTITDNLEQIEKDKLYLIANLDPELHGGKYINFNGQPLSVNQLQSLLPGLYEQFAGRFSEDLALYNTIKKFIKVEEEKVEEEDESLTEKLFTEKPKIKSVYQMIYG